MKRPATCGSTLDALARAGSRAGALAVGQLGQSLDGRIATPTGHSHYINGAGALAYLHRLRASVDAVVVGVGTALADDPALTVRHVRGTDPARVLLDPRRRAGSSLKMLQADESASRRLVFGRTLASDPRGLEVIEVAGEGPIAPRAVLAALAERGLKRVLVEGGARTVSGFLAAGALDRLCLLVGPLIVGSGSLGLELPPIAQLDGALRPAVRVEPFADGDVLFDCDLTGTEPASSAAQTGGSA